MAFGLWLEVALSLAEPFWYLYDVGHMTIENSSERAIEQPRLMKTSTKTSTTKTPMMAQWSELKAQAGKALLFFRLGDFFELFEHDALTAAPILGVTLTSRNNRGTSGTGTPLCGVPVAHLENYLTKALD